MKYYLRLWHVFRPLFQKALRNLSTVLCKRRWKYPRCRTGTQWRITLARRECPLDIKRLVYPFLRKVLRFGDICKLSDAGLDGEHVDRLGMAQQGFSADIKSVFYTLQTKQEKNIRTCFDAYRICPDISNVSSLFCLIMISERPCVSFFSGLVVYFFSVLTS